MAVVAEELPPHHSPCTCPRYAGALRAFLDGRHSFLEKLGERHVKAPPLQAGGAFGAYLRISIYSSSVSVISPFSSIKQMAS